MVERDCNCTVRNWRFSCLLIHSFSACICATICKNIVIYNIGSRFRNYVNAMVALISFNKCSDDGLSGAASSPVC